MLCLILPSLFRLVWRRQCRRGRVVHLLDRGRQLSVVACSERQEYISLYGHGPCRWPDRKRRARTQDKDESILVRGQQPSMLQPILTPQAVFVRLGSPLFTTPLSHTQSMPSGTLGTLSSIAKLRSAMTMQQSGMIAKRCQTRRSSFRSYAMPWPTGKWSILQKARCTPGP